MSRRALALALAVCAGWPAFAQADAAMQARYFDRAGRQAFERRRYDDALEHFLLAHDVAPSPRSLFNIALCAMLARRDAEAFAFFEEYVRVGAADDPARRDEAERAMAELRGRVAVVRVESDPPGATIFVDRVELGSHGVTPRSVVVPAGPARLELRLPDHAPAAARVEARTGATVGTRVALAPHMGALRIDASPEDATVVVLRDGREVASRAAGQPIELPVGTYSVRLEAPDHQPVRTEVGVRRDETTQRRLAAVPIPRPRGRLLVAAGDVTARVFVNGRDVAETPAAVGDLAPGLHRVRLEAPGHRTWTGSVRVRADRPTHLDVTLLPSAD